MNALLPPPVSDEHRQGEGPTGIPNGSVLRQILTGLRAVSRRDLLGSYLADLTAMILPYPNAMPLFLAAVPAGAM